MAIYESGSVFLIASYNVAISQRDIPNVNFWIGCTIAAFQETQKQCCTSCVFIGVVIQQYISIVHLDVIQRNICQSIAASN